MSGNGAQLKAFISDVRTFCRQAGTLLGIADETLSELGWDQGTPQNIAFANGATGLAHPDQWFPYEMFRFYRNAEIPCWLAFVSLILDDDRHGEYRIAEPLATAGWFEFPDDAEAPMVLSGSWWWCRFHCYMKDRKDDGSLHTVVPKQAWPEDVMKTPGWYPFDRASTLGVPLAEMTSSETLQTRLLTPLVGHLRAGQSGRNAARR